MQITVNPVRDQMTDEGVSKPSRSSQRTFASHKRLTGCFIKQGQNSVQQAIDRKCDNIIGNVDQELVPALRVVLLWEREEKKKRESVLCSSDGAGPLRTGFIREITPRIS